MPAQGELHDLRPLACLACSQLDFGAVLACFDRMDFQHKQAAKCLRLGASGGLRFEKHLTSVLSTAGRQMCQSLSSSAAQAARASPRVWEGDATGLGKYYLKMNDPHRSAEIEDWLTSKKNKGAKPKHMQVYVRLAASRSRWFRRAADCQQKVNKSCC